MMIDATMMAVRAFLQGGGSKQKLAEASELHRNTLADIDDPAWMPTTRTVMKLSKGLKRMRDEQ